MRQVIQGLEEGLNAIADAISEGGGGGGGIVPTPTLDDDGKVLKVVSQSQEEVAPEWSSLREVPRGGRVGQVLTRNSDDYGWADASGGLPALDSEEDKGKVLMAQYDSDTERIYPEWSTINQVPNSGSTGQVLTKTARGYGWANASGGGGNIDVLKIDMNKSDFSVDEHDSSYYIAGIMSYPSGMSSKIDNIISIKIVDNADSGYPDIITPTTNDDCAIYFDGDMVYIKISSTIYGKLGTRQANHFYMTYYTGA